MTPFEIIISILLYLFVGMYAVDIHNDHTNRWSVAYIFIWPAALVFYVIFGKDD